MPNIPYRILVSMEDLTLQNEGRVSILISGFDYNKKIECLILAGLTNLFALINNSFKKCTYIQIK